MQRQQEQKNYKKGDVPTDTLRKQKQIPPIRKIGHVNPISTLILRFLLLCDIFHSSQTTPMQIFAQRSAVAENMWNGCSTDAWPLSLQMITSLKSLLVFFHFDYLAADPGCRLTWQQHSVASILLSAEGHVVWGVFANETRITYVNMFTIPHENSGFRLPPSPAWQLSPLNASAPSLAFSLTVNQKATTSTTPPPR